MFKNTAQFSLPFQWSTLLLIKMGVLFFIAVVVFNKENAKFWSILALFWLSCREFTNFLVYFLQPK